MRYGSRTGVLLIQLGTPDAPTTPALRRYLRQFLNDPRVIEAPRLRRAAVVLDWLLEGAGTDLGRLYLVATFRKPDGLGGPVPPEGAKAAGDSLDNGRSTCYGLRGKCA